MTEEWNALVASLPNPHLLQTEEWGQFKQAYGWEPLPQTWRDENGKVIATALVLQRTQKVAGLISLRVLYVPKGPLLDWNDSALRRRVLDDLRSLAQRQGAIFVKIDPDVRLGTGALVVNPEEGESETGGDEPALEDALGVEILAEMKQLGWQFSPEQIQFRNTVMLDLNASEEEMLARMKQKTRYNVRLAARKGISVRPGTLDDLSMLYRMYAETSVRDGFIIREEKYYTTLWQTFMEAGMATPLIAEFTDGEDKEAVAAIMLFHFGGRSWYIHGMSRNAHREKMPNYLLQWEAMRYARGLGCREYDLWGAPDDFHSGDSMWGVYLFKRGLGGWVNRTIGAWDLALNPLFYNLYTRILPRILNIMRRRGRAQTQQSIT